MAEPMRYIYSIIKADYRQRTRSYSFLITLAVTFYIAYLFVPANTAGYTTLSITGYKAANTSAWVGGISAMLTTFMLSLYGFMLINSGIKKDMDTGIGSIIATTPITNFKYLLSKQLSNYLVLATITGCTFLVSLLMFSLRGKGYPFVLSDFVLPYLFFALPALFVVAALAVAGEVFLGKRTILQFIVYFFLFGAVTVVNNNATSGISGSADPFGLSLMTGSIKNQVNTQFHEQIQQLSFGFIFEEHKPFKVFVWNGLTWTRAFLLSRLLWMGLGLAIIYFSSFFFHRFDHKQAGGKSKKVKAEEGEEAAVPGLFSAGLHRSQMPPLVSDYGILTLFRTELILLTRQGNKWFWLVNGALWIGLFWVPLNIAHGYLLPILWFLQVIRWSELTTKEITNRLHYFTFASYKPLARMLPAQILAGMALALALALPVILRSAFSSNFTAVVNVINGSAFVVLLAVALGIVSGGKKLFEVTFFMLTYLAVNQVQVTDYLGSVPHPHVWVYIGTILLVNSVLLLISFSIRRSQVAHM